MQLRLILDLDSIVSAVNCIRLRKQKWLWCNDVKLFFSGIVVNARAANAKTVNFAELSDRLASGEVMGV